MGDWIKVDINTTTEGIEPVAAILLELGLGYVVQDSTDFKNFIEKKEIYWDYIDEEVMKLTDAPTIVTVYLSDKEQGENQLAYIKKELENLKTMDTSSSWGSLDYTLDGVKEEDWATSWKAFYHPVEISPRLIICPQWEDCTPKDGQTLVTMDPGMAFGTGTHESTKLCLELLDEIIKGGETVLDVGCGSGILSISAVSMGSKNAIGSDIDQVAVETAQENAKVNGVADKAVYHVGSFAQGVEGKFDIIFANIVADAIIKFGPNVKELLTDDGYFICSGIIDDRAGEVKRKLMEAGLMIVTAKEERGWVAFLAQK